MTTMIDNNDNGKDDNDDDGDDHPRIRGCIHNHMCMHVYF